MSSSDTNNGKISRGNLLLAALAPFFLTTGMSCAPATAKEKEGGVVLMPDAVKPLVQPLPRRDVRILSGPFADAMKVDREYLLRLEPDRLLSFLRKNSGLTPRAEPYGGWEIGGSGTLGHYLSACVLMANATGDAELKKRVDYIVSEIKACQDSVGDGGLYAYGWDKDNYFAKLRRGEVLKVPVNGWYVTHKLMAGVRDAAIEGESPVAREVLIRHADWCEVVTAKLTPEQWQTMLDGEHGAPHEVIADAYALTGNVKYLELAKKFRHERFFTPLKDGSETVLYGTHANTQVPKFIGYQRIYELTADTAWRDAPRNFYASVTRHLSWANGGNSQWERFFPPAEFDRKVQETCGPETCNTYNMLKLAAQLYTENPSAALIDDYENALYNHILPSLAPKGGFVYYTSQRPNHYRVFSRDFDAFWCCVGTGMENPGKYGDLIYARSAQKPDTLYVNLFIPSEATWKERGVTIRQETGFPATTETTMTIKATSEGEWSLALRKPKWLAGSTLKATVNGKPVAVTMTSAGYGMIQRVWKVGDIVKVDLPMTLVAEPLPGGSHYVAFKYGPVLLAGTLGRDGLTDKDFYGGGPNTSDLSQTAQLASHSLPTFTAPVLVSDLPSAVSHLLPIAGKPLNFRLTGTSPQSEIRLIPLYRLFYERYAIYWRLTDAATAAQLKQQADLALRDLRTLSERTIDRVSPSVAESEQAHGLETQDSASGRASSPEGFGWRDAKGWFRYRMRSLPDAPIAIRCAYWGSDSGRTFDIVAEGKVIATQRLTGERPGDPLVVTYPIPPDLTRGKSSVTVEFRAAPGSVAGGVFDVRTVKPL